LNISAEKLGVGFVYRKSSFKGTEMDVTCINNRIISLTINTDPLGISLTNVYAPHAGLPSQTKTDFYDSLAHLVRQQPPHQINLILGDFNFNARLMEILPGERMILGQFIYRDPESAISNLSSGQLENQNHRPLFRRNMFTGKYLVLQTDR
jgi:hypothetical protein